MSTDQRPLVQQQLDGIVKEILQTYRIAIYLGFAAIFVGFLIAIVSGDELSSELGNIGSIVRNLKDLEAEGFFGLGIGIILLAPIVMLLRALLGFLAIKDQRFVVFTGIVALILVASTIFSIAH